MKILAVCGLGMGTSLILRMNIEKIFSKYGLQADVEHVDVSMANQMASQTATELIVTSDELKPLISAEKKLICIKNFIDLDEIENKLLEAKVVKP